MPRTEISSITASRANSGRVCLSMRRMDDGERAKRNQRPVVSVCLMTSEQQEGRGRLKPKTLKLQRDQLFNCLSAHHISAVGENMEYIENIRNLRGRCVLRRDIIREFLAELLGTFVLIVSLSPVRTLKLSELNLT